MEGGLLSLKWNNHQSSFIHVLSTLRRKEIYTDVTLACDGKFFPTHKLVLSTCSEYFQEILQQTLCKHPVIVLKDIQSEELEALLNYMYIGEVNVIQEKLSGLIKVAECLKIKGLAVPDDPPPKVKINEKRSLNHGYSSEKKQKKKETDYSSTDDKYQSSNLKRSSPLTNLISLPSDADTNVNLTESVENIETPNMEIDSTNNIKEEPIDIVEVVDNKEGILFNFDPGLSRSSENISESQDSWKHQNCHTDEFSIMEDNEASNTEESSLNDKVLSESNCGANQWVKYEISSKSSKFAPRDSPDATPVLWPLYEDSSVITTTSSRKNQFSDYSALPSANFRNAQCFQQSQYCQVPSSRNIKGFSMTYTCNICRKVFSHKGDYKRHMMTHTGERPFKCPICEFRSSQKGNLFTHLKKVHSNINTS